MNKWRETWEKKKDPDGSVPCALSRMLISDGYDTLGTISPIAWREYVQRISTRVDLRKSDSIFDVGCGAGAFLWPLHEANHPVGGIDYAARQIALARTMMPSVVDFKVGEASSLSIEPRYQAVVSCGTFLYFPDLDYAELVVRKMIAKTERIVAILDLPDLSKKAEIIHWRMKTCGENNYKERYEGLSHLYYAREWFHAMFTRLGLEFAIEDQDLENYNHAQFRFNVFAWKQSPGPDYPATIPAPGALRVS